MDADLVGIADNEQFFEQTLKDSKLAIERGIFPERIGLGTSGSYFVKGTDGSIVGVFKPSDEEPYADKNPNWSKALQRIFFPCFFGRSW